jgi:DNA (cytosine-5)-methyltransferase 1
MPALSPNRNLTGVTLKAPGSTPRPHHPPTVAEFFAGIGLARLGLEAAGFKVSWSNDYEPKKKAMYAAHFAGTPDRHTFILRDIASVAGAELPADLTLAWASFPCTDLSLAGKGGGIRDGESKTFWEFVRIIGEMGEFAPAIVCLENVPGLASSHGGDDLRAAVHALNTLGYSVDVLSLDALRFVPQSRERLFLVCAKNPPAHPDASPSVLRPGYLKFITQDASLRTHAAALPIPPECLSDGLDGIVEDLPNHDRRWWSQQRAAAALASLSPTQARRIELLKQLKRPVYRTGFRRTRNGKAVWEFREDNIAGCLRTARGGSSKQALMRISGGEVAIRWMTPREYARLMGADDYVLDTASEAQAIFGFGDAVCVPAIQWLAANYLMPLARSAANNR